MSSDGFSEAPWKEQDVRWSYRLGEITLASIGLRLLVHTGHFSEITPKPDGPSAPHARLEAAVDGALVRSHPVARRLPRLEFVGGLLRYCPSQFRRFWVDLTGTFPDYLAKFSSKSRSTISRKVKRFRSQSGTDPGWREYRTPDEIEIFFPLAREVSRKTYQERLLNAGLPSDEGFLQECRNLALKGRVRGYLLFMKGRPIAYLYCPLWLDTGIVLYRYLGYDPEFEGLSPGTVLQYFALERLFREGGLKMFDFLEGETPQKELFATDWSLCADVFFLKRTPRNLALVAGREMTEGLSDVLVRGLELLGMKRWMKRFFRRRGGNPVQGGAPRT